jgi:hypothetical protein
MNAQGQRVDVLAVMDRALGDLMHAQIQHSYNLPLAYVESNPAEFSAAIAAVAKLIAADKAFDTEFHAWMHDRNNKRALDALCSAADVRASAIARTGASA